MTETGFTEADRKLLARLDVAVFGIPGTEGGGLLNEMQRLNVKLGRLNAAVIGAALSFAVGSIAVCLTLISTLG